MATVESHSARPGFALPAAREGSSGWLARWSWALFDWAQQPYYTLVGTYIFRPYYVGFVAATPVIGQSQIGWTSAIAGLIVAVLGPLIGVFVDGRNLKAWLAYT